MLSDKSYLNKPSETYKKLAISNSCAIRSTAFLFKKRVPFLCGNELQLTCAVHLRISSFLTQEETFKPWLWLNTIISELYHHREYFHHLKSKWTQSNIGQADQIGFSKYFQALLFVCFCEICTMLLVQNTIFGIVLGEIVLLLKMNCFS